MFALELATSRPTAEEKGKAVLGGTLLIHGMSVRVLFDIGASHSFISHCLVDKLNLEPSYLVTSLRVANPIGGYATLGMRCDHLEFELLGHVFACSLHVFDFAGFRIILGMDWLSKYDARIFCHDRKISLRHADCSDRIIYSVENPSFKVKALLGVMEEEDELNQVFVVREFADVFEPVIALPSKRTIEFRIDLVPGAEPVSRLLCRMTPIEIKELKVQLVDLEGKNFIRPSSSP